MVIARSGHHDLPRRSSCSLFVVTGVLIGVTVWGAQCSDEQVSEEELLESGRPALPRRVRLGALLVAGLAVCALIVVRGWPHSAKSHHRVALPSTSLHTVAPTAPRSPLPPWPTAPEACGGDAELPVVSSTPAKQRTGIKLLVGGVGLGTVDFDSGHIAALPNVHPRSGEYVVGLLATSQTYAVSSTCATTGLPSVSRLVRIGTDGNTGVVPLPGSLGTVFGDGPQVWGVTFPDDLHPNGFLVPLDGGKRVRLPAGFWPVAITRGVVVGNLDSASTGGGSLVLVDAATGLLRTDLGAGQPLAIGHGVVLWAADCYASIDKPCTLHRRSVAGGATVDYRLPRSPGFTAGVIRPDGRLLAFTLERGTPELRYQSGHPIPPADVAILHLDTGTVDVVPGIEVPAKQAPGLTFSADGRWLVVALNAGTRTRLLAWRAGLTRPYESRAISGLVWGPPAIIVLPPRAGG